MANTILIPVINGKRVSFKNPSNSTQFTASFNKNVVDIRMINEDREYLALLEDGTLLKRKKDLCKIWSKSASTLHDMPVSIQIINEDQFVINYRSNNSQVRKTRCGGLIRTLSNQ